MKGEAGKSGGEVAGTAEMVRWFFFIFVYFCFCCCFVVVVVIVWCLWIVVILGVVFCMC